MRKNGKLSKVELYDKSTEFDPVQNKASAHPEVVEQLKAFLP